MLIQILLLQGASSGSSNETNHDHMTVGTQLKCDVSELIEKLEKQVTDVLFGT